MSNQPTPQDPSTTWTSVDAYATHALLANHPHASALSTASLLAARAGLPDIAVSPLQGAFLATQCQLLDARRVLEIGTLAGSSAIWMATSGPRVHVTTIEVDAAHARVAREAVKAAGLEGRVEVLLGDGREVLVSLRGEVERGERGLFDFVFVDADKRSNRFYLEQAVAMCRARAAVVVDNVVRGGRLASEEAAREDEKVEGARLVVEAAGRGGGLMGCSLVQTVGEKGYDGFLIGVVGEAE